MSTPAPQPPNNGDGSPAKSEHGPHDQAPLSVTTISRSRTLPTAGESITSGWTGSTYTIGEKIGEGFFSDVYSCRDQWENDLAAKVLKQPASYEACRTDAIAEFEKLRVLRNPFVTFVFDAFEYRNTFYIITERCYGPINALLDNSNIDARLWIMPIARCILQAVHYLHVDGYVHQDIHAGNVFAAGIKDELAKDDPKKTALQFKLADLGVAKFHNQVHAGNLRAQWMLPPEVLDEHQYGPIDRRVDIYHLGLLFLQLAYSKSLRFTQAEILAGKPREMALLLPAPYNFAIEKALRRRVPFRTASALELWRDLKTPVSEPVAPPTAIADNAAKH